MYQIESTRNRVPEFSRSSAVPTQSFGSPDVKSWLQENWDWILVSLGAVGGVNIIREAVSGASAGPQDKISQSSMQSLVTSAQEQYPRYSKGEIRRKLTQAFGPENIEGGGVPTEKKLPTWAWIAIGLGGFLILQKSEII